jgi:predicted Zn finger-like uncharacterized protein
MLIVCPSCVTSYDVELASSPPSGRQVRCLRCRTVWHAEPNHANQLLAAAAITAPGPEDAAAVETISRSADELTRSDAEPEPGSFAVDPGENDSTSNDAVEAEVFPGEGDEAADEQAPPIVLGRLDEGRPVIEVESDPPPAPVFEPAEDIESAAPRRRRQSIKRRALRWPMSQVQTASLALALVSTIIVGWRSDVVRVLPQTASFYALVGLPVNLRGLAFEEVVTSAEQHEGVPILVVEGNVFNGARKTVEVPRLKFAVRNAARQEIYSWTAVPSRASLLPGEALAFRSRLASPPADAHDLVLRFVSHRDVAATR